MPIINSGSGFYVGRLFDIQLSAELRHRGLLIYQRSFEGANPGIVSASSNTIILPDHYFVTGEKLRYDYEGAETSSINAVGIATTSVPKVGLTNKLPREVYAVKVNDIQLSLAATREDALLRTPKVFDIQFIGAGLTHTFTGEEQNTRSLVTIDNVIQSPVIETIISTRLKSALSGASDLARFVGITSFFVGDLLKIDDEILAIEYVGLGDENTVLLRRPVLGTELSDHVAGSRVVKLSGNYNIVDSTIYFPVAPFGVSPVSDPNNPDPEERDYAGVETSSTFDGRVFLRNGFVDTDIAPYATNYLFDDISPSFLGISSQAILTQSAKNITGFATNQGLVLINNVLQTPGFIDFGLGESSGITTISFTGSKLTDLSDINTSTIPRGGIIVQIGTNDAFGYQPRVSAGGTVQISIGGTVETISIGNSGSGYRASEKYILETKVSTDVPYPSANIPLDNINGLFEKLNLLFTGSNISIVVKDRIQDTDINTGLIESNIISIGATDIVLSSPVAPKWKSTNDIKSGDIVYLTVQDVPVGFADAYIIKENNLSSVQYEHIGFSTISDGRIRPTIITNTGVGFTNFKLQQNNSLRTAALFAQKDLQLANPVSISTVRNVVSAGSILKDAKIASYNRNSRTITLVNPIPGTSNIPVNSPIEIKIYDPLKIKYDEPLSYDDLFLEYANGSTGIGSYAKGNLVVSQGFTIKDFEITNTGYSYGQGEVLTVPTGGITGIPTITEYEVANIASNAGIMTGSNITGSQFGYSVDISSDGTVIAVGSPNDTGIGRTGGAVYLFSRSQTKLTPTFVTYDPETGIAVFTVQNHGLSFGQTVSIKDESLTFTCSMDNNRTENKYPESDQFFSGRSLPIIGVTSNTFTLNVGASGPNEFFTPSDAVYNPATGDLELNLGFHNLDVGEGIIILDNSLSFTCDMDNNQSIKTYPRPGIDPFAGRSIKIKETTPTTITINAGISSENKFFTPTDADYDSVSGILTVTVGQHGLGVGRNIVFKNESLGFSCTLDGNATTTYYPRSGQDPFADKKSVEIIDVGFTSTTADNVEYDAKSGLVTFTTVSPHGFSNGDYILIVDNSLTFTCDLDGNTSFKTYPRPGYDRPSNRWLEIGNISADTFQVNIGSSPDVSDHTFIGAISNGILHQDGTFTVNVGGAGTASGIDHTFEGAIADAIEHLPQSTHKFVSASESAVQLLPQSVHTFVRAETDALTVNGYINPIGILTGSQSFSSGDLFGYSVSVGSTGSPIIVGSPGAVDNDSGTNSGVAYAFDLIEDNTDWTEVFVFRPKSEADLAVGGTADTFGSSVCQSDDGIDVVIGSKLGENPISSLNGQGVVFYYQRFIGPSGPDYNNTDVWSSPNAKVGGQFGSKLEISRDGEYLLIQAQDENLPGTNTASGIVYLYKKLVSPIGTPGSDDDIPNYFELLQTFMEYNQSSGRFGNSLAISDDSKTIAIGTKRANSASSSTGSVVIYDKSLNPNGPENWSLTEYITGSRSNSANDSFGESVSLSGNGKILVVGAPLDEGQNLANESGIVYVFDRKTQNRVGNDFVEVGISTALYAYNLNDNYGFSVSLTKDGSFFIAGAPNDEIDTVTTDSPTGIATYGVVYGNRIIIENKFTPLLLSIDKTFSDSFSGWTFGSLQVLDSPETAFNGSRRQFPLKVGGNQISIEARPGSQLELAYNLIVQINDIYQVPNESYTFNGGSSIIFNEAPRSGDKCVIIFYRGTDGVDTRFVNILETIKKGDTVTINDDDAAYQQNIRTVSDIITTDIIETNIYTGSGIDETQSRIRPITWCKQLVDKVVAGEVVGKSRVPYEPEIYPTTKIIKTLGFADDTIWVQNVKTFFDSNNEYDDVGLQKLPQRDIFVISNDIQIQATATVSIAGSSVSSVNITNPGLGYVDPPSLSFSFPTLTGFTTTNVRYDKRAEATAVLDANGSISNVIITEPGIGYTSATLFIGPPSSKIERIDEVNYEGDFGWITGISTTSTASNPTNLVLDLFIPLDSYLRNSDIVTSPLPDPVSGLTTEYYFSITESNIGDSINSNNPLVSLDLDGNPLFYGDTYIDGVYQVDKVLTVNSVQPGIAFVPTVGIAFTDLRRVVVPVQGYAGIISSISGLASTEGVYLGKFSWGRLVEIKRGTGKTFNFYNRGNVGITTSADVVRINPLKYDNYTE